MLHDETQQYPGFKYASDEEERKILRTQVYHIDTCI